MFVHLQLHSEYALQDSLLRINEIVAKAKDLSMPAVALTDVDNLFAFVKFYEACIKAHIKPLCGVELTLRVKEQTGRILLLAKNKQGYQALLKLVSLRYLDAEARDGLDLLKHGGLCHDLLAIISPWQGITAPFIMGNQEVQIEPWLEALHQCFHERLYFGLMRSGLKHEERVNRQHSIWCERWQCAPVALAGVCMMNAEDFAAHEVRVCIHEGSTLRDNQRPICHAQGQVFADEATMQARFADCPAALANTALIAKRCTVFLTRGEIFLPKIEPPDGQDIDSYFHSLVEQGLSRQVGVLSSAYQERLRYECGVIEQMGYVSYFLIVADFITWAKDNGIPVGPGRGSGAGSLVAYALGITALDPLRYSLLFERFLNPERVSMPDFDIDFCMLGRDRVIEYVQKRYGSDAVAQIITYGTMAAKAVVRDVARVMGHPYGLADRVAKLIPFELGITLTQALEREAELRQVYDDEATHDWLKLSLQLEGLVRNVGRHAGGVVIAPGALTNFTALYQESLDEQQSVTQYDKDDIEKIGLVKFDFLGLRTLTIIDWACQMIHADAQPLDINTIALDDAKVFQLLSMAKTTGVFQVESRGMKDLLRRLKPDCFEDIIALVALYRPGPLQSGMVDDFIARKHGQADIVYPHALLEDILAPTYGVILYQEQVMQIAQVLSGYTLGSADLLRRAMGKKKLKEMIAQRAHFVDGAKKQGVDAEKSGAIFDLVEKFAGYGFNKSHSAAYALITYQTAWLKVNHPHAFMAATLSSDMDNTDKVVIFMDDARALGIRCLPPCVQHSEARFTVEAKCLRYGLAAIKGLGQPFAEALVQERQQAGPFSDLLDLCVRMQTVRINRKILEVLIKSGAVDALVRARADVYQRIDQLLLERDQRLRDSVNKQNDLLMAHDVLPMHDEKAKEWPVFELLHHEYTVLGQYLSGHPAKHQRAELDAMAAVPLQGVLDKQRAVTAGVLLAKRAIYTKTGRKFWVLTLEDETAKQEFLVGDDAFVRARDDCQEGQLLLIDAQVQNLASGQTRIFSDRLYSVRERRIQMAHLLLHLPAHMAADDLQRLMSIVQAKGEGRVRLAITWPHAGCQWHLPANQSMAYGPDLESQLSQLPGLSWQWQYRGSS